MRWDVLTVDALHVLAVCKARLSVGSGAAATPPLEAAVRGVAMQLSLEQRKHRFKQLEVFSVPRELEPLVPYAAASGSIEAASGGSIPASSVEVGVADALEADSKEVATEPEHAAAASADQVPATATAPPRAAAAAAAAAATAADTPMALLSQLASVYDAAALREAVASHPCASLPTLPSLYADERKRRWANALVVELDTAITASADVVTLTPDASKRMRLLRQQGYLEAGAAGELTLKGRCACELKTTVDELVLSECVCTGLLHPLSAPEVAGLLSLFVSKGKAPKSLQLPAGLESARNELRALAAKMAAVQIEAGVLSAGGDEHVHFVLNDALIEAAYHWADGASFATLREHTVLAEGDIVRILSRVEELAKEVKAAAWWLGDAALGKKLDEVLGAIKRDVVAAPSLYTDGGLGVP